MSANIELYNRSTRLYANGNIREDPQVHLAALEHLELLKDNLARGGELFLGEPSAVSLDADAPITIGKSRAFRRAAGGDGDAPLVPLDVLHLLRRECRTATGEYSKRGDGSVKSMLSRLWLGDTGTDQAGRANAHRPTEGGQRKHDDYVTKAERALTRTAHRLGTRAVPVLPKCSSKTLQKLEPNLNLMLI